MSSAKRLNFHKEILFSSVSIMVSEYIKPRDRSLHVISSTWTPSGDKFSVYMALSGCDGGLARIFHMVNTYAIIAYGIVNCFIYTHVQFKTDKLSTFTDKILNIVYALYIWIWVKQTSTSAINQNASTRVCIGILGVIHVHVNIIKTDPWIVS